MLLGTLGHKNDFTNTFTLTMTIPVENIFRAGMFIDDTLTLFPEFLARKTHGRIMTHIKTHRTTMRYVVCVYGGRNLSCNTKLLICVAHNKWLIGMSKLKVWGFGDLYISSEIHSDTWYSKQCCIVCIPFSSLKTSLTKVYIL